MRDSGLQTTLHHSRKTWITGPSHNSSSPQDGWQIRRYTNSQKSGEMQRYREIMWERTGKRKRGTKGIRTAINQHPSKLSHSFWLDVCSALDGREHRLHKIPLASDGMILQWRDTTVNSSLFWWYLPCENYFSNITGLNRSGDHISDGAIYSIALPISQWNLKIHIYTLYQAVKLKLKV